MADKRKSRSSRKPRRSSRRSRPGRRSGDAVRGLPAISSWSSFAGGGYDLTYDGRKYSISPKHRTDEQRRSGGWALSVSPAPNGLHGWIDDDGQVSYGGPVYNFRTPQSAVVAARAFARRVGHEPHGIMEGWSKRDAAVDAIMRAPDFWRRVEKLRDEAAEAGDLDMARICRVALSDRKTRPMGHDAREVASALYRGAA